MTQIDVSNESARWFCITEDEYMHQDFFEVLKKRNNRIKIIYVGHATDFDMEIMTVLNESSNYQLEISDIFDQVAIDSEELSDEEFNKKIFQEVCNTFEIKIIYFFDSDRLNINYFKDQNTQKEVNALRNKLYKLYDKTQEICSLDFHLMVSYPSVTTFVYYMDSFITNGVIKNFELIKNDTNNCKCSMTSIYKNRMLRCEACVSCFMRRLGNHARDYGKHEKKYLCRRRGYQFLEFLENMDDHNWKNFYTCVIKDIESSIMQCTTLNDTRISKELLERIFENDQWISLVPLFINELFEK